jgi:hypothetical protein
VNEENPEPWQDDHPQRENWPSEPMPKGPRGSLKSCLSLFGIIFAVLGVLVAIVIWKIFYALFGGLR